MKRRQIALWRSLTATAACALTIAVSSPASAHTSLRTVYTWNTANACAASSGGMAHGDGYWPHIPNSGWASTALSYGPSWCHSNPKILGPNHIRVHTVTYKNGDGAGGYEIRHDWGVTTNPSNASQVDQWRNGSLAAIWGPGYYTNDVGSSVFYSWCGHCGGWAYALVGHWL